MTETTETLARVLQLLGMFARADQSGDYQSWAAQELAGHEVLWPFVCQRGEVVGQHSFSPYVHQLKESAIMCMAHSYVRWPEAKARGLDSQVCRWHPVVDPGIVAAFNIGGPDAVAPMRGRYDKGLWSLWETMIERFVTAVENYDDGLATGNPEFLEPRANLHEFTLRGEHTGTVERFSIRLRPGGRRKRRKSGV